MIVPVIKHNLCEDRSMETFIFFSSLIEVSAKLASHFVNRFVYLIYCAFVHSEFAFPLKG